MVVLLLLTSPPRTLRAVGGGSTAGPSHSRHFRPGLSISAFQGIPDFDGGDVCCRCRLSVTNLRRSRDNLNRTAATSVVGATPWPLAMQGRLQNTLPPKPLVTQSAGRPSRTPRLFVEQPTGC